MNGGGDLSLDNLDKVVEDIELELGEEEDSKDSQEFLNLVWNKQQSTKEKVEKAFGVFDSDGDGFITTQDLECVLKMLRLWESGLDSRRMMKNKHQSPPTNLILKVKF